ncbi:Small subunit ribosomal protein S22 [Fasciola gigantica]|uniref:Small subunit ribosomal protein S22 n=1 Tax=Fasciola gigantica TaxID=46835 RepID=A0A504YSY8_FASGI|nr:Small subunit ribosomal protein S22 [Fasciola gigantica]
MPSIPTYLIRLAVHDIFRRKSLISIKGLKFSTSMQIDSAEELKDLFANPRIHNLLRLITYRNDEFVHKPRFRRLQEYNIKMLSDKELEAVKAFSSAFTSQKLQMPPVLAKRTGDDIGHIISTDPGLQGLLPSNNRLVFTDISLGQSRRNRLIVVREPNGDLRHASMAERERINGVYFPLPGRRLRVPLMFSPQHLQHMLERHQFLYILDRACVQFEPDDPQYIQVCHAVYDAVNELAWTPLHTDSSDTNPLRSLRHTRHFGPLALYMIAQMSNPGPLVYEALHSQHFARLGWLLQLIALLRSESKFALEFDRARSSSFPTAEVDATEVSSDQAELNLSPDDALQVLSFVEIFVEHHPLPGPYKILLKQQVHLCREGLNANKSLRTTG